MITLFTIGHSNHPLEKFIRLLEDNGIMTLVDVRTAPYSRYHPHFNKENLEAALRERDIQYAFAGKYLGGRPTDPNCYKSRRLPDGNADYLHEVDYPEVMKRVCDAVALKPTLPCPPFHITTGLLGVMALIAFMNARPFRVLSI